MVQSKEIGTTNTMMRAVGSYTNAVKKNGKQKVSYLSWPC
jgi:hypothetical protein